MSELHSGIYGSRATDRLALTASRQLRLFSAAYEKRTASSEHALGPARRMRARRYAELRPGLGRHRTDVLQQEDGGEVGAHGGARRRRGCLLREQLHAQHG